MYKDQIFFAVLVAFVGGVTVGSFFVILSFWVVTVLVALVAAWTVAPSGKLLFGCVVAAGFGLGLWSVGNALAHFDVRNFGARSVDGTARVVSESRDRNFYREVIVSLSDCGVTACPRDRVLWQAPVSFGSLYGEQFSFRCDLTVPENFSSDFDYRMFLAKEGVGWVCKKGTVGAVTAAGGTDRVHSALLLVRQRLTAVVERFVPAPEAGLGAGLIFGGDDLLSIDTATAFRRVGLTHIIAVSGYNLAIIAEVLIIVGLAIGLWRKQAMVFAGVGVFVFLVAIGWPASAARAGLMVSVLFVAAAFGRLSRSVNGLLLVAALMLVWNPLFLRYDIGFQLSFLATLAILLAAPFHGRLLRREFFGRSMVEIVLVTLSVEVLVTPIILAQFGTFSVVSILANMLVLPTVPFAMFAVFVTAVVGSVMPWLGSIVAFPTWILLRLMTAPTEWLAAIPWANVMVPKPGILWFVAWYGIVAVGYGMMKRRLR